MTSRLSAVTSCVSRITAYGALCRWDAGIIAFLSYLVGDRLAGGYGGPQVVLVAVLVTLVSTNFIYSFNSLADWREDRIDHPKRPIPSGRVSLKSARRYAMVLLAAAVVYPFVVATSPVTLGLLLLLPALGLSYSAPPVRLRRFPWLGVIVISIGLVTPLTLGAYMASPSPDIMPVTTGLFLFCMAVVPLKAVEEVREDGVAGRPNLYSLYGPRMFLWTVVGLILAGVWSVTRLEGAVRMFVLAISAGAMLCVIVSLPCENRSWLYRAVIVTVIVIGAALFFVLV